MGLAPGAVLAGDLLEDLVALEARKSRDEQRRGQPR
jgi:hypothetical protein